MLGAFAVVLLVVSSGQWSAFRVRRMSSQEREKNRRAYRA